MTSKPAAASGSITFHQMRLLSGHPCTHSSGTPPAPSRTYACDEAAALVAVDGEAGRVDVGMRSRVLLDEGPEGVDVAGLGGLGADRRRGSRSGRRAGCG